MLALRASTAKGYRPLNPLKLMTLPGKVGLFFGIRPRTPYLLRAHPEILSGLPTS